MSLSKVKTTLKQGASDVTSVTGLKKVMVHAGIGAAIGAVVFLILRYIFVNLIYAENGLNWREEHPDNPEYPPVPLIGGFSIFPDRGFLLYDELLLIVVTVLTLTAKKLWFTVGFFLGWYTADYLGLYTSLSLPVPEA